MNRDINYQLINSWGVTDYIMLGTAFQETAIFTITRIQKAAITQTVAKNIFMKN